MSQNEIENLRKVAIENLNNLNEDPEESHMDADELLASYLRSIGEDEVADAYDRAHLRIGFWYA